MVRTFTVFLLGLALYSGFAAAQTERGELLYSSHCNDCHTTQVHWRDKKVAQDWTSLVAEVRRWQAATAQNWTANDVDSVARFLNLMYYHF